MLRIIFLLLLTSTIVYADEDLLEQRINDLTNQIEQINHKYDLLLKKFEALAADVEFRFKELEKNPKIGTTKTTSDPKTAFEKAYVLLKERQYEKAEIALSDFLKTYPNSEYSGAAYYWLGESFMLRKRYDKAAVNYIQSFTKFPKNNKADMSMLKLSSALNALGKKKEACAMLAKLKAKNASLTPAMQKLLQSELAKTSCKTSSHN